MGDKLLAGWKWNAHENVMFDPPIIEHFAHVRLYVQEELAVSYK